MLRRKLKIMKKLFICLFLMVTTCCFSQDVHVNGYITGNGTYVQPHYRTAPDNTQYNNYSTVGNVNPYTGKAGYIQPTYGIANVNTSIPVNYTYTLQASVSAPTISGAIESIKYKLLNSGLDRELIERIKNRFNSEYITALAKQSNSYSSTAIINWLYDGIAVVAKEEFNNYSANIIGKYFYLKRKAVLWDSPIMATNNSLGEVSSLKVYVIEKSNDTFYKVQSGNKIGYITAINFK